MATFSEKAETKRRVIECILLSLYNRNKILAEVEQPFFGRCADQGVKIRKNSVQLKLKLVFVLCFQSALLFAFHFNHLSDAF